MLSIQICIYILITFGQQNIFNVETLCAGNELKTYLFNKFCFLNDVTFVHKSNTLSYQYNNSFTLTLLVIFY